MKKNKLLAKPADMSWGVYALAIAVVLILSLGLCFGLMCLEALFVMLLWNAIVPSILIIATPISFWGAMGLSLLCSLLFGSATSARIIGSLADRD
jgi:hypothetical protein